ncbi:glycoside hydrolase family 18 protein [Poronia punctata]|nr:glycoside hydrolase family 18 protein [Poronia punctata]
MIFAPLFMVWLTIATSVFAKKPSGTGNIALYWGQNSANRPETQRPLIQVCQTEKDVNIIILSFLLSAANLDNLNFANAARPTEHDINTCKNKYGKTIILSLGGMSPDASWNFASPSHAIEAADRIYHAYGPAGHSSIRPFGSASVSGFDLDFETRFAHLDVFAQQLRSHTLSASNKMYLSAAPQCPFPDHNVGPVLHSVHMDFIFVQFYNNPSCDLRPSSAAGHADAVAKWDDYARQAKSMLFLGVPATSGAAAAASYANGNTVAQQVTKHRNGKATFAGVMIWDSSQLDLNPGFLTPIVHSFKAAAVVPEQN